MNNYEISRDRAQSYFLGFDQDRILEMWQLDADQQWIYVTFFSKPYRICRKTGAIFQGEAQAGFEEVLSIFDLLCHQGNKYLSGHFAPVNSLKGRPRAIGVGTDFHHKSAAIFDSDPAAFRKACLSLGATEVDIGDMGFQFPVFGPLSVILKFYHADEDFSAGLTLLWDDNTLQFLYYETVFYIAGFLLNAITREMQAYL